MPVSLADIKAYSKKKDTAQHIQPNNNLLLFLYSSLSFFDCFAIIFYNTLNPCLTCNQTINLIINILRSNYKERLHAYLINLKYHPEFYPVFNLKGPLNLVIIPINDGTSFGYKKLSNPQSAIYDPISFKNQITEFIDNSIY